MFSLCYFHFTTIMNMDYSHILDLLDIPEETTQIEFKTLWWQSVVKKVRQTIVAMSNTYWWQIILWIDDPEKTELKGLKRVKWIEENLEVYDEIFRWAKDIHPAMDIHSMTTCTKINEIDRSVCIINIPKWIDSIRYINNEVWIRWKKWNIRLDPQETIKYSYARGFEKADSELVNVDLQLLETDIYKQWKEYTQTPGTWIEDILTKRWLARKKEWVTLPTRAAVMLFAEYPTNLMDTKCVIRVYQYSGTLEKYREVPNLLATPKTIEWPIITLINEAQQFVLWLLRNWVRLESWFINKYVIPKRAIEEAITNAVIHRDYHIKRDIEIKVFEDRIEVDSPWLFSYNITPKNIWTVRADNYRNDLLVKHLREFPSPPNLDRNEWVIAMRNEMRAQNLFPPIYITYPSLNDTVRVVLFNEHMPSEWDRVIEYFESWKTYITNQIARNITGLEMHAMSQKLKHRTSKWLLIRIPNDPNIKRGVKYKLGSS